MKSVNPNVLLAFKHPRIDNPTACHQGMGVTATNAALALREMRIPADAQPVLNGEYLWAKLNNEWSKYTHVVLCAPYIDAPFTGKMVRNFPWVSFALVYHSNLGFLTQDAFAAASLPQFLGLADESWNFKVAANSHELANAMASAADRPFLHLPNLYHLPGTVRRQRSPWKPGMLLHIGLFGAARVLKNWLTAAVAAMIIQRMTAAPVNLHVSEGRDEGAGATRANLAALLSLNPGVNLVGVPWLAVDDFRRYLYGMDLMLQPSFTETFNSVTADGCAHGVPSVVSEAIDWVPADWVAKADSASDIALTGVKLLRDRKAITRGWKALDAYVADAGVAWKKWIYASV